MKRAALLALTVAFACSKPEPPTITPKQAAVTGVTPMGIALEVELDAANPNGFTLSARSVKGTVKLGNGIDVGTVTAPTGIDIPAHGHATIKAPLSVPWGNLGALVQLAASEAPVPYTVDGTVTIGGDKLNVDVPYHLQGSIPHDDIMKATMSSIPGLPGFRPPR